jgi:hypothetical protein
MKTKEVFWRNSRHLVLCSCSFTVCLFDICGSLGGVNLLFLKWNVPIDKRCPFYEYQQPLHIPHPSYRLLSIQLTN